MGITFLNDPFGVLMLHARSKDVSLYMSLVLFMGHRALPVTHVSHSNVTILFLKSRTSQMLHSLGKTKCQHLQGAVYENRLYTHLHEKSLIIFIERPQASYHGDTQMRLVQVIGNAGPSSGQVFYWC